MATFQFFNVRALPHSGGAKNQIGNAGYKKLFAEIRAHISRGDRARNILGLSYKLRNDFYFSILHIHIGEEYAYGKFLKFDKPENLVDTISGHRMQGIPENASAHRHEFEFVFVYECHTLALQQIAGKSPNPTTTTKALDAIISPNLRTIFPDHYLKVDVLTSDTELRKAISSAEKFKNAKIDISLTNSDEYLDEEAKATEEEMKALGVAEISHTESASKNGFMSSLSKKCLAYLIIARKNGNATIRFFEKGTGKIRKFVMRDHPIKKTIFRNKKMKEDEYLDSVKNMVVVTEKSTRS